MLSIEEVIERIGTFIKSPGAESVDLLFGLGRVIALDVISRYPVPPHDICNMEGYAVNAEHLMELPAVLKVIGKSTTTHVFEGTIGYMEAVKVYSGCAVPDGANAVIPAYKVTSYGTTITVSDMIMEGQNIANKGIDIARGDIVLSKGTLVNVRHIALAATLHVPWLPVVRQPKIGILVCNDSDFQLNDVTSNQNQFGVTSTIATALAAMINAVGGQASYLGHVMPINAEIDQILSFKKDLDSVLSSIDVLVTVGGMNNMDENILWTTLNQKNAELEDIEVGIGGGEKMVLGHKGDVPIIGLPGNHVSAFICASLFLRPTIEKMILLNRVSKQEKTYAILSRNLDEFDLRTDYLYAKLEKKPNGDLIVSPVSAQDTLMLSVLTKTDCLIVVDKSKELITGVPVEVILFAGSVIST